MASSSVRRARPLRDRGVPVGAGRRMRATLEVVEGRLVRRDHAGARPGLDGHVADGHPGLHRQGLDGLAAVLDDVALAPAGADLGDDGQDDVLGRDAVGDGAPHVDGEGAEGLERQRLRGEHVLDLGRADAEGERPEGAVGGGVAVAADHGHARLRQAELRTDDVDDALVGVAHRVEADAELLAVAAQGLDLDLRHGVGDGTGRRRDVVVLGRERQVRAPDGAARETEPVERLGTRHLVEEMEVDVEEIGLPLGATYDVCVPDLLGQCPCHGFL